MSWPFKEGNPQLGALSTGSKIAIASLVGLGVIGIGVGVWAASKKKNSMTPPTSQGYDSAYNAQTQQYQSRSQKDIDEDNWVAEWEKENEKQFLGP